ncbi:MAG: hypothetical protein H0W64_11425 [Gammaproteobacteria bacterium]|nr:hypothetical protein [Gammaproteobacteria bacterium]
MMIFNNSKEFRDALDSVIAYASVAFFFLACLFVAMKWERKKLKRVPYVGNSTQPKIYSNTSSSHLDRQNYGGKVSAYQDAQYDQDINQLIIDDQGPQAAKGKENIVEVKPVKKSRARVSSRYSKKSNNNNVSSSNSNDTRTNTILAPLSPKLDTCAKIQKALNIPATVYKLEDQDKYIYIDQDLMSYLVKKEKDLPNAVADLLRLCNIKKVITHQGSKGEEGLIFRDTPFNEKYQTAPSAIIKKSYYVKGKTKSHYRFFGTQVAHSTNTNGEKLQVYRLNGIRKKHNEQGRVKYFNSAMVANDFENDVTDKLAVNKRK